MTRPPTRRPYADRTQAARSRAWPRRFAARARGAPPRALLRADAARRRGRACSTSAAGALGLRALEPELDITGVDLAEQPGYPGPFVRADAAAGLPFADGEFDLVYCSSVIEHVPPARRARVRRGAAPRGARLVRADARLLVPDRAPLAAARARTGCPCACAGATGGSARPATGRRSRCCAARELEALFGPAPRRALRAARQELGVRASRAQPPGGRCRC